MQSIDYVNLLKQSAIFSDLDEDELEKIANVAFSLHFKEGRMIVQEGDNPLAFYVILHGRVKVFMNSLSGKEFILDVRRRGETFSDAAALDGEPYFASSQALDETTVIAIKREDILPFVNRNPIIAIKIVQIAGKRLRNSYNKLISLASDTVDQRLVNILLLLSSKYGTTLLFNRQEIAEMIGATIETSTRVLTQLKNLGIVSCSRGQIIILDRNKLQALNSYPTV